MIYNIDKMNNLNELLKEVIVYMLIELNLGKWGTIFPVPSCIVDQDIVDATSEQLKVILFILRYNIETLNEEIISDKLQITKEEVINALEFWVKRGVLSNSYNLPQKSSAKINSTEKNKTKRKYIMSRQQKPDPLFIAQRLGGDEELSQLLETVESTFSRPLSSGDIATLVMLHETDGLPCSVIAMLVYYCQSIGKTNMHYIEKIAVDWANNDITTIERANDRITELNSYNDNWNKVARICGINSSGYPTKAQQENANRWINEWKFTNEMIKEAYERCVNQKMKFNLAYTNGILNNWYNHNICNLQELNKYESNKNNDKKSEQISYDIDSYENYSMFD